MKRTGITLALAITASIVAIPGIAHAYTQVCVADPVELVHNAYVIEDDDSRLNGMIVRPFPNSAVGCVAYDGTPLQEWETLYVSTSTPAPPPEQPAPTCESVIIETSSTQTITNRERVAQLNRQLNRKDRLIAKLRRQLR